MDKKDTIEYENENIRLCSEDDFYFRMVKEGYWERRKINDKNKITNGDIIKTLFSDFSITPDNLFSNHLVIKSQTVTNDKAIMVCLKDWWDEPYKKPITMSEAKELEMFDMIAAIKKELNNYSLMAESEEV